jgi:two-component system chemotaxis response regulator CheY
MPLASSVPVLVVDDSKIIIAVIDKLLRQIGFAEVDDAADGLMALAKMRAKRYGLVISDWNMQSMTGQELLRQVRSDPALKSTPFIMMTAESNTARVIAAKRAGVDNYVIKPFTAQMLKKKIDTVFAARNAALAEVH